MTTLDNMEQEYTSKSAFMDLHQPGLNPGMGQMPYPMRVPYSQSTSPMDSSYPGGQTSRAPLGHVGYPYGLNSMTTPAGYTPTSSHPFGMNPYQSTPPTASSSLDLKEGKSAYIHLIPLLSPTIKYHYH